MDEWERDKAGRGGGGGVELLVQEAGRLNGEARFAEALRAAEKAVEGARGLGDLGLEVKAIRQEADALRMLGDDGAALARLSWILGIAGDPVRRSEVEQSGVTWEIASAYWTWVNAARFRTEVPTQRLFAVLDAGEAYVRSIGRPEWRGGDFGRGRVSLSIWGGSKKVSAPRRKESRSCCVMRASSWWAAECSGTRCARQNVTRMLGRSTRL
jgi:hypothetical protein